MDCDRIASPPAGTSDPVTTTARGPNHRTVLELFDTDEIWANVRVNSAAPVIRAA